MRVFSGISWITLDGRLCTIRLSEWTKAMTSLFFNVTFHEGKKLRVASKFRIQGFRSHRIGRQEQDNGSCMHDSLHVPWTLQEEFDCSGGIPFSCFLKMELAVLQQTGYTNIECGMRPKSQNPNVIIWQIFDRISWIFCDLQLTHSATQFILTKWSFQIVSGFSSFFHFPGNCIQALITNC